MHSYMKTLLDYRKTSTALQTGKLVHFIPVDGIYTYFRYNDSGTVMVVMNNNEENQTIETGRYGEFLKRFSTGRDVISKNEIKDLTKLALPAKSVLIIELKH